MTEPERCSTCDTRNADGNAEGTLCRECVQSRTADADTDARERAIERRVEDHLDREQERRYGR
jgi:hypothetical protein